MRDKIELAARRAWLLCATLGATCWGSPEVLPEQAVASEQAIVAARRHAEPLDRNQVGFPIDIQTLSSDGVDGWSVLPDGRPCWTGQVHAPDAKGLRLRVSSLELPDSWILEFVDGWGVVRRTIDGQSRATRDDALWSPAMEGDRATIRLVGPSGSSERPLAAIDRASYFFAGFDDGDRGDLLPCQTDARCGGVNATALASVGLLTYQLASEEEFAVGCVLVADSLPNDRRGYVLTVARVGEPDVMHNSIDIRWHYINRVCAGGQLGTSSYSHGASRLVHAPESDLTLLEPWEDLPTTLPPIAAPWTSQPPSGLVHALHFPAGASMRYGPGLIEPPAADCPQFTDTEFFFHDFLAGTVQPTSEGGGVFDSNWNLVGLLSATCAPDGVVPDCDNHDQVSIVSSRLAARLPELTPWLMNQPLPADQFEPNNTMAQASPIVDGEYDLTLQHDSYDWYAYTAPCTGILRLAFEYPESRVLLRVTIFDEDGQVVAETQQNQNGRLELTAMVASQETYHISVFLRDQDGGPYHMSVALDTTTGLRSVNADFPHFPDERAALWATGTYGRDWFVGVQDSDLAAGGAGAVYVYRRVADGSWCLSQILTPELPRAGGHFGSAIAVTDDGKLFIGAPGERTARYEGSGRVYLFENVDGLWTQQQVLGTEVGRHGDQFGAAVDADGTYAIFGAPGDDLNGHRTGAAYIFGTYGSPDGQTWIEQSRVDLPGIDTISRLGAAVQITGTTAFATMPGYNGERGGLVAIKRGLLPIWGITQVLDPHEDALDGAGTALERIGDQLFMGGNALNVYQLYLNQWWNIGFVPPVGSGGGQPTFGSALVAVGDELLTSQVSVQRIFKYRAVNFELPVRVEEIMHPDLPTTGFGFMLTTDGQALLIDIRWTTAWDDDCNADGVPDSCQVLSGELDDANLNGIADDCERPVCAADLAEPLNHLDFFDIQTFLNYYANDDARADLAPPFCRIDFFDVQMYLQSFSAGCE